MKIPRVPSLYAREVASVSKVTLDNTRNSLLASVCESAMKVLTTTTRKKGLSNPNLTYITLIV